MDLSTLPATVSVDKAAELVNKSPHSLRQLLSRGKIRTVKEGRHTRVDLNSALTYHARKKGLLSWEENIEKIKNKSFMSVEIASAALAVQPAYLMRLIKTDQIEGYVTAAGDIMISRDSINAYLRQPDAGAQNL